MVSFKHCTRFSFLSLLLTSLALGQVIVDKGIQAGFNLAKVSGNMVEGENIHIKTRLGFSLGGYVTFNFGLPLLIRSEVMLSQKGYKLGESDTTSSLLIREMVDNAWLLYIDMNALIICPITSHIQIFAGPAFSPYLIGWRIIETEYGVTPWELSDFEHDSMNGLDRSMIFGAAFSVVLPGGNLNLQFRYCLGLKNAYRTGLGLKWLYLGPGNFDDYDYEAKNNVIQILVGYEF